MNLTPSGPLVTFCFVSCLLRLTFYSFPTASSDCFLFFFQDSEHYSCQDGVRGQWRVPSGSTAPAHCRVIGDFIPPLLATRRTLMFQPSGRREDNRLSQQIL